MSCNITKQQIHKSLLDKSFEIALTKNKAYFINGKGEIGLMVNPKVISENTPYRVRQKIDILSRKLAKDLNIPIDKYGVVFGGKTYTDGAALEIIVTPRLLEAYQVKNNEKKIEEAFVEEAVSEVKKGVPELFESNPELANAVYEALGFKSFDTKGVSLDTKERDGWKWIKLNGKNIGEVKLVKNDRRSKEVGLSIKLNEEYQNKGYGQIVHTLVADWAKNEFGDTLYSDFDNSQAEINTLLALTKKGYAEQIGDYGTQKDGRYSTDVRAFRIKTSDEIRTITPQQKQQAHQLYSQYLDTGRKDIQGFKNFVNKPKFNKELALSEVKKGVPELFESNPELANAVYEALGFKTIPSDISKIKDFEGTIIEYVEHIGTHKDGRGIGARNINKGEKIQVVLNEMRKKFEEKSWVNPVNSEPLSQDAFSSFEELMMFMYLHEKAHEYILQEEGESLKSYETRVNNEALKRLNSEFKIAPQQKQQAQQLYSQYLEQTGKQDIEGFKEFISSTQTPLEKIDSKSKLKTEAKFQITKLGDGQFLYAGDIYPSREDAFRAFEEDNTPSIQEAQIPISQMDRIIDNLPPFTGDMEDLGFEEEACDL